MKILHINNTKTAEQLNKFIHSGKDVFILIYMEGCGPCNMVRPEWTKLEKILQSKNNNKYNNVVIANIESEYLDNIKLNSVPESFPNIKHISNKGTTEDTYDKVNDVNAFMGWINATTPRLQKERSKWTKKYKNRHNRNTHKKFSKPRRNNRSHKQPLP